MGEPRRQKESQKQKLSMLDIRKMTAEHAGVRSRVELVRAQLRRLRVGLDQIVNSADKPAVSPASAETEPSAGETCPPSVPPSVAAPHPLPADCRQALQAAGDREAKEAVVRQYFEVEAELSAEIRTIQGRKRVSFQPFPLPPLDRLYFLRETAQIILAQGLTAKALSGRDPQTGDEILLPIKDFVRHVRKGVWLLQPKPPAT